LRLKRRLRKRLGLALILSLASVNLLANSEGVFEEIRKGERVRANGNFITDDNSNDLANQLEACSINEEMIIQLVEKVEFVTQEKSLEEKRANRFQRKIIIGGAGAAGMFIGSILIVVGKKTEGVIVGGTGAVVFVVGFSF